MFPFIATGKVISGSLAVLSGSIYSNRMTRRRSIVFALTIALAFSGFAGPRHARAAVQNHDHSAVADQLHKHSHNHAGQRSHDHGAAPASHFGEGGKHDHAGTPPATDQGCCYAWCNSVAIVAAADWLFALVAHDRPLVLTRPFQIASISSAIDPPPR